MSKYQWEHPGKRVHNIRFAIEKDKDHSMLNRVNWKRNCFEWDRNRLGLGTSESKTSIECFVVVYIIFKS